MNNRQKAKHFKRLYEQILTKRVPYVVHVEKPRHYEIVKRLASEDVINSSDTPALLRRRITDSIVQELKPLIWQNIIAERELYTGAYRYQLDVWFKS